MPETPVEPNEFITKVNEIIEDRFKPYETQPTNGATELTGAEILTASEQRGKGTITDASAQTEGVSPGIETTTSVTPDALASQTIKPTLEAEKDETAGSFATSEQDETAELETTTDHGPVLDPTSNSL